MVNPPRLLGLFSLEPSYVEQVDQHLGELLDSPTLPTLFEFDYAVSRT